MDKHTAAFEFWRRRSPNGVLQYLCPSCRAQRCLYSRIVDHARACPYCGTPVTLADIDLLLDRWEPERQETARRERARVITVASVVVGVVLVSAIVWFAMA